jgi:spore germination protein YaaH
VQVDGKNYYSYTVEPKDGLYAISRKFGVSQADLHACNKGLESGLTIGQIILVPVVGPVAKDNAAGSFVTHEVLPKQTVGEANEEVGDAGALQKCAKDDEQHKEQCPLIKCNART